MDDAEIDQDDVLDAVHYDQIQVQRLKKRKLALRDLILRLENILLPDIIA